LPIQVGSGPVLMSESNSEAVVRLGVYQKHAKTSRSVEAGKSKKGASAPKVGWSSLPEQHNLRLRMSGLLWPEAAQRLANTAYLTRESKGNGQIILFANSPTFRASNLGTTRLFLNALVYGPGLGTEVALDL